MKVMHGGTREKREFSNRLRGTGCWNCGRIGLPSQMHVHRILPGRKGGEYVPGNMAYLCVSCDLRVQELDERKLMKTSIEIAKHWARGNGNLPVVDLTYDEEIDWDRAISLAKKAKALKRELTYGIEIGFGRYIAELSTVAAVEHGGIAKFAKSIGMNYSTIKKHRSRYLESGRKRRYVRKVTPELIELPINDGDSHETGPVKDEVTLTGEDALLWRKLKPRLKLLEHENRQLRKENVAQQQLIKGFLEEPEQEVCPHCSAKLR